MKKILYDLFSIGAFHFDFYQDELYEIDPKKPPNQLISELSNLKIAERFVNQMNIKQTHGATLLRKYTIIHWCLIHEPQLCQNLINIQYRWETDDEWLTKNILKYYASFLQKICGSEEYYKRTKPTGVLQFSFDILFYLLNLLKDLFLTVKKISPLARYYKKTEDQSYKHLLTDFVYVNAYHAQELYTTFKIILAEIIRFPSNYVRNEEEKIMLKYLLEDELIKINEEMKNLFLDKYFYPYGKGYSVKLMKIEQLTENSKNFVDDLLFNLPLKIRKPKKKTLDSVLFDEQGKLNPEVVQNLAQIRLGDQTMRNSFEQSFRSQRQWRHKSDENIQDV